MGDKERGEKGAGEEGGNGWDRSKGDGGEDRVNGKWKEWKKERGVKKGGNREHRKKENEAYEDS